MAEAGLLGFAETGAEIRAVDGVGLGFRRGQGHAGGGRLLALLRFFGLSRLLLGGAARGVVEGALVLQTLLRQALVEGLVLGLFDLADEVVDGELGFAGAGRLRGHDRRSQGEVGSGHHR